jgi:branched-chain amino acid transport system ATP-binding protein
VSLLELRDVHAHYEGHPALRGVTLSIEHGELAAIVGPNGSGKTTALRAVAGTVRVSGEIRFEGELVTRAGPAAMAKLGVAHVPQGRAVFGSLSVLDNLKLGAWYRRGALDIALAQVFEVFPILHEHRDLRAGSLSAAEQTTIAVGRAVMAKPRLLLCDELSYGVSPAFARELLEALRRLNEAGTTVVVAEQRPRLAVQVATRAFALEQGRVSYEGPAGELPAVP